MAISAEVRAVYNAYVRLAEEATDPNEQEKFYQLAYDSIQEGFVPPVENSPVPPQVAAASAGSINNVLSKALGLEGVDAIPRIRRLLDDIKRREADAAEAETGHQDHEDGQEPEFINNDINPYLGASYDELTKGVPTSVNTRPEGVAWTEGKPNFNQINYRRMRELEGLIPEVFSGSGKAAGASLFAGSAFPFVANTASNIWDILSGKHGPERKELADLIKADQKRIALGIHQSGPFGIGYDGPTLPTIEQATSTRNRRPTVPTPGQLDWLRGSPSSPANAARTVVPKFTPVGGIASTTATVPGLLAAARSADVLRRADIVEAAMMENPSDFGMTPEEATRYLDPANLMEITDINYSGDPVSGHTSYGKVRERGGDEEDRLLW